MSKLTLKTEAECRTIIRRMGAVSVYQKAALLQKIQWMHHKTNFTRNGKNWYTQTAEEVCDSLGMTIDEYKKAIVWLKSKRLVETVTGKHQSKKHVLRCTWYRLTEKGENTLVPKVSNDTNLLVPTDTDLLGYPAPTPINSTKDNIEYSTNTVYDEENTVNLEDMKKTIEKKKNMSFDDIKSKSEESMPEPVSSKCTVALLEQGWIWASKKNNPKYFHCSWTTKQKAVAKNIIKAWTPEHALDVMKFTLLKWGSVCAYITSVGGFKTPKEPDLYKILWKAQTIINFYLGGSNNTAIVNPNTKEGEGDEDIDPILAQYTD